MDRIMQLRWATQGPCAAQPTQRVDELTHRRRYIVENMFARKV